ncbi:MAG: hypothetical protein WC136_01310 [Sphaerochaeta sp.]|jgi:hypothetical protein
MLGNKRLLFEKLQSQIEKDKTPVYIVKRGDDSYPYLCTFSWDDAYNMYLRETKNANFPYIEIINVQDNINSSCQFGAPASTIYFSLMNNGDVIKHSNDSRELVLSSNWDNVKHESGTVLPYDSINGFYSFQPVWCWSDRIFPQLSFWDVKSSKPINANNNYYVVESVPVDDLKNMKYAHEYFLKLIKENHDC